MRESTQTHVYYTKDDCDALDGMPLSEVADVLDGIEGTWMPGRPSGYYELNAGRVTEAELDFDLLRAHKALDIAVRELRRIASERKGGETQ